jgi:uncharacterized membrane protein YhhN
MKRINLLLHLLIVPLFAAELVSRWNGYHTFEYFIKPWLMIWVALFFYLNTRGTGRSAFIYLAFLFSWVGDLFLMAAHSNEMLFYAGVGSFFLAQLSYIRVFILLPGTVTRGFVFAKPVRALPFLLYLVAMLALIMGGMKGIMIPVIIIYAVSLITMSMAALNRKGIVSKASSNLVFAGSVLFVISDSMIAIDKFFTAIPKGSFFIMLTYFIAQYLIMQGLIRE